MPSPSPTPDGSHRGSAGRLFVVATPIGNLDDITLRALKVLADADLIAAEDTRHTARLLKAHGIRTPLVSYHEHNEERRTEALCDRLQAGDDVALTTDAGTPLISDPGYRLVSVALAHHITVIPIPGVCAAITAMSASGLPTDRFTFVGFPARKKAKRLQQLEVLASFPHPLIFYQSPRRLTVFLEEIQQTMGNRPTVLARELTKVHEEFLRGSLSDIVDTLRKREAIKGECTLIVSGAAEAANAPEIDLEEALRTALARQDASLSTIAKTLAYRYGLTRKTVYDQALRLRSETRGKDRS